jgi:hypothetical protein
MGSSLLSSARSDETAADLSSFLMRLSWRMAQTRSAIMAWGKSEEMRLRMVLVSDVNCKSCRCILCGVSRSFNTEVPFADLFILIRQTANPFKVGLP